MENNLKNKLIMEVVLMIGVTFILMLATTLPIIDLIGIFIVPVPITILCIRHSKSIAFLGAVISGILFGLFNSPFAGFQASIIYGIIGVIVGHCIIKNKSAVKTLLYLIGANFISIVIQYVLGVVIFSKTSLRVLLQNIVDTLQENVSLAYEGVNNPATEQILQIYKSIDVDFLMLILPAIIIIQVILLAFLNFTVIRYILKRFGYNINSLPKFSEWYVDCRIGAILIVITCIVTVFRVKEVSYGDTMFVTVYYILLLAFIIDGLSVVTYLLKNKLKISKVLIVILDIMIIMSPFGVVIFLLGLIDLIVDIRGVDPNSLGTYIRSKLKVSQ